MMPAMHRLGTVGLVALATAVSLLPCPAQEVLRKTAIGTVTDGNGAPLAEARVYFAFVPVGGEHLAPADAVEATTDKRGRYRVSLLPCAKYRAWAIGKASENGDRLVSDVAWTSTAELLELRATHVRQQEQVTLTGLDQWQDDGPFRVRWLVHGVESSQAPVAVAADGAVKVPPIPATRCAGELLNARNEAFEAFIYDGRRNRDTVRINPPREIPTRAIDDAGKPVEDVEIWERISSGPTTGDLLGPYSGGRFQWRRLGATDAEGRLVARVAARNNPMTNTGWNQVTLLGKKAGYASCFSGFRRGPFKDGKEFDREGLKELPFLMHPAKPLRGRVRDANGAVANQPFRIVGEARIIDKDGNGWIHEKLMWSIETDAEGRFEIAEMPASIEKCFVLPQPHAAASGAFPEGVRRNTPPQPLALHPHEFEREKENDFDLSTSRIVSLQILDAQSGPARGVRVMFISQNQKNPSCEWWTPQAVPDRAGRLAMRLEAGKWFVFVRNATAMASVELDLTADEKLTLKLEPMPAMRGTVIDADGKPIANAELDCHSSTFHSGNDKSPLQPIASSLNWRWIDAVRTDAEGSFVCAFLDMPNTFYEARFKVGKRQSGDFRIVASDDPETIIIK